MLYIIDNKSLRSDNESYVHSSSADVLGLAGMKPAGASSRKVRLRPEVVQRWPAYAIEAGTVVVQPRCLPSISASFMSTDSRAFRIPTVGRFLYCLEARRQDSGPLVGRPLRTAPAALGLVKAYASLNTRFVPSGMKYSRFCHDLIEKLLVVMFRRSFPGRAAYGPRLHNELAIY